MDRYQLIFIAEAVCLFLIFFLILCIVFSGKKTNKTKIKRNKSAYSMLSKAELITALLTSLAVTFLLSRIHSSLITSSIIMVLLVILAPYFIINNLKRKAAEDLFANVVTYCQNTALLLKQSHNAYHSLQTATEDVANKTLKEDLIVVVEAFKNTRKEARAILDEFEKKYPYSIVKSLNIILIYMEYDNAHINDDLLDIYSDDVQELQRAMKQNMSVRKVLRMQYIGISVGCVAVYWFFLSAIKGNIQNIVDTTEFAVVNLAFIVVSILLLYIIDAYFDSHIAKE